MADDDIEQPQRELSPIGLYSYASEVADRFPQMVGTPEQFKAMLTKQGVKPDELKWSGYDQAFAGQKKVTKQALVRHFKSKFSPGGKVDQPATWADLKPIADKYGFNSPHYAKAYEAHKAGGGLVDSYPAAKQPPPMILPKSPS